MTNPAFWQGKRVFITGHTGFKGSWLSLWLSLMGAEVTGYALPPAQEQGFYVKSAVESELHSIHADIRDLQALQHAVQGSNAEIVIHMAAQPLVRASYRDPAETYAINVMGTVNLLEVVRKSVSVKAVLVVTTDKCYDNQESCDGYLETDRLGGHDPYSSSKACAEIAVSSYRDAFLKPRGVGVATARAGNVIGGGDWGEDRLMPDLMRGVFDKHTVRIRYPQSVRPWQHVLDPLAGYLLLGQAIYENPDTFSGAWNFGPSRQDARSVSWILQQVETLWPGMLQWEQEQGAQPHETAILTLNAAKASALGWRSCLPLETGMRLTVDWYHALYDGRNMRDFSRRQIMDYALLLSEGTMPSA